MEMMDNPRGYAFVSLVRGWERMCGWNWFATMNAQGMMPTKSEYISDGLRIFDSLVLDMSAEDATNATIKALSASLRDEAAGKLSWVGYAKGEPIGVKYVGMDQTTLEQTVGQAVERGYGRVELSDEVVRLVEWLRVNGNPAPLRILETYLKLGDPTNAEIASHLGVARGSVKYGWTELRELAGKMELV